MNQVTDMKVYLDKISRFENLTFEEMEEVADNIFSGLYSQGQIIAFLTALKMKGETVDEVTGLAKTMADKTVFVPTSVTDAMDNCGTGGDGSQSFNISTTTAFVLSAGGINVAKHGNRSISSKSGSADVLEKLGINLSLPAEKLAQVLEEIGIVFLFAQNLHPKMKEVMPARLELGIPTIMNLIGPLINPVNLESQLLGTSKPEILEQTAQVLNKLGRKRALVISGANGMDEASLFGVNKYAFLEKGRVSVKEFSASDIGLKEINPDDIRGGDAKENAEILLGVLHGEDSAYLETTVLNAGLGFYANGKVDSIEEGCTMARDLIKSGKALEKLELLQEYQR